MRTDLTPAFEAAMQASGRSPRLLAVFHFKTAGDVYVSDHALGAADGLEAEYGGLVEDWGDLVGSGDSTTPDASEIRQMTITLWNGGGSPFSDYFLEEDPEDVEVDLYQCFAGLADSDKALIDRFVCQDPIATDEATRLLRIDLVSLPMRYSNPVGEVIKIGNWPDAKDEDMGKYIPVPVGSPGYVRTLCVRTAAKATLSGSILEDTMSITAFEDLDAEGFPESGIIQIGAERISYSGRGEYTFTVSQRGADGTQAVEHLDREEIQEHVTDFTYLIGAGPISAVNGVKVAGLPAPEGIYTAYTDTNPAKIVFSEKPYALDRSKGSTFLEMQFDAVADENTALQPHLAYDSAAVTSAARISEDNPLLALTQVTSNPDRGEIVKAYLAVEWWASGTALQHDRIKVTLGGATLGYLEKPNEYDELELDAEVDIDHGHAHSISGEHTHTFTDPSFATSESPHTHAASGISETVRRHATSQVSIVMSGQDEGYTTVPGYEESFSGATLHFRTSPNYGCLFRINNGEWISGGSGDCFVSISVAPGNVSLGFKTVTGFSSIYTMMVYEIYIDYVVSTSIQDAYTGVTVAKTTSGVNATDSDKASTDVNDLATGNRELTVNDTGLSTRTVVELFDITDTVNCDWTWFTNKGVRVEYEGTVDNQTVYILHVFFDVEYRRIERIFSDEVMVDVGGIIDDSEGTYTGIADALITRPEHVRKWLLMNRGGLDASYIDTLSFNAAGARYSDLGYHFDGVIDGELSVREADRKLAKECRSRFFWDAGKAYIKLRERHSEWEFADVLTQSTADLRLMGMGMQRKNVADMINRVHLYYYRDWSADTTGKEAYLSVSEGQINESIAAHGIRENPERFMFDLVRSVGMAADLRDFYLEDGKLSQYYTIQAFLPYFDLQKEDCIRLTSDFMSLTKAAMRICDIERVFGSGKLKRINMLRIIAETWFRLMRIAKQDTVKVADLLHIDFAFADHIINQVGVSDLINFGFNFDEEITVAEALAIVIAFAVSESETVTCTDSLACDMNVALSDPVTCYEWLDSEIGHGFGMGSFGMDRFGSMNEFDGNPIEHVAVGEELVSAFSAVFSDTVTCTDELLFSSGFGSPWSEGEGFGDEPFGR